MALPWRTLERVASAGGPLELRQRGERDFLIVVGGRVLMNSSAHRSERELATWVCEGLRSRRPRVLIAGLGMGYTLRAALDVLPPDAVVRVAELEPAVVAWCRGPLATLSGDALGDPRVDVAVVDVMEPVRAAASRAGAAWDAIALDLFAGPDGSRAEEGHPVYGDEALGALREALAPEGVLGIWSETGAPGFPKRLARAGLTAESRRAGHGGRRHVLYRARRRQAGSRGGRSVRGDDGTFHPSRRRR